MIAASSFMDLEAAKENTSSFQMVREEEITSSYCSPSPPPSKLPFPLLHDCLIHILHLKVVSLCPLLP
uniref:Uncharacterized protein n=1 Tax=Manihot esculenta TaxID=3983 RepID=A0A2C9W195_MANES